MATAEHDDAPPAFRLQANLRAFKTPASIIHESEMLEFLRQLSDYQAWRCGLGNSPDGNVVQTKRNFHLRHLNPLASPEPATRSPIARRCVPATTLSRATGACTGTTIAKPYDRTAK